MFNFVRYNIIVMTETIVKISQVIPRTVGFSFPQPVDWEIKKGEQWALIGPNGAGKSLMANVLRGGFALRKGSINWVSKKDDCPNVEMISFKDIHSLTDTRDSYYQQRWQSTENEEMPTGREVLSGKAEDSYVKKIVETLGASELLEKKITFLSSGELRKFLIIRVLVKKPRILILDNPFIGLDAPSRKVLVDLLSQLEDLEKTQAVLLLSNIHDIPETVTHVMPMLALTRYPTYDRPTFMADASLHQKMFPALSDTVSLPVLETPNERPYDIAFRLEKVNIRYGKRTILEKVEWEVRRGEHWSLTGPNGCGKSTLLSLLYADNPQAYANTYYLFDRKRGTGESIWDIKKRIGYVSPEIHLYFRQNVPLLKVVASGFYDSIGLFRPCTSEQEAEALRWMDVFGIKALKDRLFLTLSSGEQRLALLARAFVKDPDLLILDEPLHGLDERNKQLASNVIERFCARKAKTLVYVTHYPHEMPALIDHHFRLEKH